MALYYHLHMQPSEIERMPYYEYEITIENLQELLKEKAEAEKKAYEDGEKKNDSGSKYKTPKTPKMPSMPKFK